eukprot:TRINITY_DN65827_c9_g1_i1.p1 TRINITY_DN65827_c9_g1~~TRINITY_DN65827_c9_g1_i1.p1  ORF type:complete len:368 (+),score=175.61 TRINITY_DN65827_c9_g1_i1:36-1106(+)
MANPFAQVNDPFEDPAVTGATNDDGFIDEYNPFDATSQTAAYEPPAMPDSAVVVSNDGGGKKQKTNTASSSSAAAYGSNDNADVWAGSGAAASGGAYSGGLGNGSNSASIGAGTGSGDLASREEMLRRKEQALVAKERELERRERALAESGYVQPNWPCSCYAITYHSIRDEIPEEYRPLVTRFYACVLYMWLAMFWNWVVILASWFTADGSLTEWLWASIFVVSGVPGAWSGWYRQIYYATRDKSSRKWVVFFFNFGVMHIGFSLLMTTGVPGISSVGLWFMIEKFANSYTVIGLMSLASTFMWITQVLLSIYLLKKAYATYKSSGADKKVKQDVAKAVVEESMRAEDEEQQKLV